MSQGSPARADDPGDVRTDSNEFCPLCHGEAGHHHMRCPNINSDLRKRRTAQGGEWSKDPEAPPDTESGEEVALPPTVEGSDEIPPAKLADGKPLSQEQIADHFATADKLFAGKKFEDGAVVEEDFDEHKVPPTDNDVVSSDMLWLVAKICHEVNRVYCQSIADHSQSTWDDAPDWQRESAFNGVTMHFENPEATTEDSHKSWLAEKVKDGWEYGPVKDETAKRHPCLVPYNQLPPAQQYKDALFSTICKTFFGDA